MFKYLNIKINKGFTLIETLVAILLLTVAIAGPLTLASKGLTATLVAKEQFTGFYLAQDAIEFVRYVRDSNSLGAGNWLTGAGAGSGIDLTPCLSANGCYIDSIQSTITPCGGVCPVINYNPANHFFSYTSGAPSAQKFIRTVKITNTTADEAVITVTISWNDRAGTTRVPVTVRENIFKWQ